MKGLDLTDDVSLTSALAPSEEASEQMLSFRAAAIVACSAAAVGLLPSALQPPAGVDSWLMFDGVCNLCDGFVNFVYDGDSGARVKFGAQQKHMDLLSRIGAPTDLSTLVLIQGDQFYTRSNAALRTLALMDWPYKALAVAWLVPSPLRDLGYVGVANVRYQVFGKRDECRVPTGDFRRRFIDYRAEEEGKADPISGIKS